MTVARHHLTIAEKNQLRAVHRERPELTQEQLREWAHAQFGKWAGRSTVGKIAGSPDEQSANPTAKRVQSGRYPDMEQKLFELIVARQQSGQEEPPVLSEGQLWEKANELLGPGQSVSVGWVQRFKKRHGLHRSQRTAQSQRTAVESSMVVEEEAAVTVEGEEAVQETEIVTDTEMTEDVARTTMDHVSTSAAGTKRVREEASDGAETEGKAAPPRKKTATSTPPARSGARRKQFVSADDILLLTQVLATKPWAHPHVMDGWQEVCQYLREHNDFNLDKSAGACQARVALLLDHLRAGNVAALRKSGTVEEYERKRGLLVEMHRQQTAFEEFQEDMRKRRGEPSPPPPNVTQHDAAVAKVGEVAAAIAVAEATGEADRDGQRRLELLEIRMERELADQRRHADEQMRQLERLQRAQVEAQQNQHAQLLSTIQQQQAMMLDLIKTVAVQAKNKD